MTSAHLIEPICAETDLQLSRKKKSSKSQDKDKEKIAEREKEDPVEEPERIRSESPAGSSGRNSPAASSSRPDRKTKAEKRFEEVQRKRVSPLFENLCRDVLVADRFSTVARKGGQASPYDTQRPCSRVQPKAGSFERAPRHSKGVLPESLVRAQTNGVFPHRLDPDNDLRRPCLDFLPKSFTSTRARFHWGLHMRSTVNYNHEQYTGRVHNLSSDPVFIFGSPRV